MDLVTYNNIIDDDNKNIVEKQTLNCSIGFFYPKLIIPKFVLRKTTLKDIIDNKSVFIIGDILNKNTVDRIEINCFNQSSVLSNLIKKEYYKLNIKEINSIEYKRNYAYFDIEKKFNSYNYSFYINKYIENISLKNSNSNIFAFSKNFYRITNFKSKLLNNFVIGRTGFLSNIFIRFLLKRK